MQITYQTATVEDIGPIYAFCKQLIEDYEQLDTIDLPKVLQWVRRKIETQIDQYSVIYADGQKAGYYRFYQNEDGAFEIDDLYIFAPFQNRGIGSGVIGKCCAAVNAPVMLYVFIRNTRAVALYERLGFAVTQTIGSSRYIMKRSPEQ